MNVNPQGVSHLLSFRGLPTVGWADALKVEGVSVRGATEGRAVVTVNYKSRAVRDEMEGRVLAVLVKAGYRVTGSGGVLWVAHV